MSGRWAASRRAVSVTAVLALVLLGLVAIHELPGESIARFAPSRLKWVLQHDDLELPVAHERNPHHGRQRTTASKPEEKKSEVATSPGFCSRNPPAREGHKGFTCLECAPVHAMRPPRQPLRIVSSRGIHTDPGSPPPHAPPAGIDVGLGCSTMTRTDVRARRASTTRGASTSSAACGVRARAAWPPGSQPSSPSRRTDGVSSAARAAAPAPRALCHPFAHRTARTACAALCSAACATATSAQRA